MRGVGEDFAKYDGDLSDVSVAEFYGLEAGAIDGPESRSLVATARYVAPAPDDFDLVKNARGSQGAIRADDPDEVKWAIYERGDRVPASKISITTFQSAHDSLVLMYRRGKISAGGANTGTMSQTEIGEIRQGAQKLDPDAPEATRAALEEAGLRVRR